MQAAERTESEQSTAWHDAYDHWVADTAELCHKLTDRLDLRAICMADVDAIHRTMADPRNRAYIPGGSHKSLEETRAWVERLSGRWGANHVGYGTVRLRATGDVIGVGGVDRRRDFWNLYYLLDSAHWGRGYGSELAWAGQQTAAAVDPDLPLAAWIHAGNVASQHVAHRVGLRDYGQREPEHWKGEPMHYWADREPAAPRIGSPADGAAS
jgi:RimJ/RimL family protein N-acetyltransferase